MIYIFIITLDVSQIVCSYTLNLTNHLLLQNCAHLLATKKLIHRAAPLRSWGIPESQFSNLALIPKFVPPRKRGYPQLSIKLNTHTQTPSIKAFYFEFAGVYVPKTLHMRDHWESCLLPDKSRITSLMNLLSCTILSAGRSIFGALSHLQHHLASLTVDCHMAEVQTELELHQAMKYQTIVA